MIVFYAMSAAGVVAAYLAWKTQALWALFAAAAINGAVVWFGFSAFL